MGWRDLLTKEEKTVVLPWVGGRSLHFENQRWKLTGIPAEHGWYEFHLVNRVAILANAADANPEQLRDTSTGYLVGNRFVPDNVSIPEIETQWPQGFQTVFLLEQGLERFCRIEVGTCREGGRVIFKALAFPLGPENEVLSAYLDQKESVASIKELVPSLQAAFELETRERNRAVQRRLELERRRQAKADKTKRDARREELANALGTGRGRREMALIDFHSAAEAALAIGGAILLDVRNGLRREKVVRYRLDGRRYECVCDVQMRIIDAGVCLTDEDTGEKGDTFFTLESLPAVIRQADREGILVVYRHV